MLKQKTIMNKETADWAENKGYYAVVVSRLYYSMYQKLLLIVINNDAFVLTDGKNSHLQTFKFFIDKYELAPEQLQVMFYFNKFKELRVIADYKDEIITKDEFERKTVKSHYYQMVRVLDNVIIREGLNNE